MNRRRTVRRNLGFGSILLLVAAAVVISAAGVFHAYIKNRQIQVSREIKRAEDLISQHELDIKTSDMLLSRELNQYLLRDRLRELSSDLRPIPDDEIREIDSRISSRPSAALARTSPAGGGSGPVSPSPRGDSAVASVP